MPSAVPATLIALAALSLAVRAADALPIDIRDRLEPMLDRHLIESFAGGAALRLHRPERREIVFRTDAPWEGNASAYQSVFLDNGLYRMYYRAGHYAHGGPDAARKPEHPWFLCYAESDDGVHWRRPELGLFEFEGSRANNIVLTPEAVSEIGGDPAHTAAFRDDNPACPPEERYKIIIVGSKPLGMYVLVSGDGVRFSLLSSEPIQTEGAFDSQNLVFWDPVRHEYREYHRGFRDEVRDILTAASADIRRFPAPQWLEYPEAPTEHLYTNAILPYYRAPHILIGFPARYVDRGWTDSHLALPGLENRRARAAASPRYGSAVTDTVFLSSRDAVTFNRWPEAFIRPGPRQRESWVYGDTYAFWGLVETKADLDDAPNEMSLYATEGYWEGTDTSVRRYALRLDGFVSVNAPLSGGQFVSKPIVFQGERLSLNAETSAAGSIRVEIQDAQGHPLPGYGLEDCAPVFGDSLDHVVRWSAHAGEVSALAGQPIRLRFVLEDADLYALRFEPSVEDPPAR